MTFDRKTSPYEEPELYDLMLDNAPAMLRRARERATAAGLRTTLVEGDMRDFAAPRRYARAICAFNAFAHCETPDDQIATLRCIRKHLEPGGALVLHMSYPRPDYWNGPDGEPVLEMEKLHPVNSHTLQMWDTRFKDVVGQCQRSHMEMRELGASGEVVARHRSETTQRWVYRYEMELLLRVAGFTRWEIFGDFGGAPLERPDQQMIAWGWNA